jgi:hypothetical protein
MTRRAPVEIVRDQLVLGPVRVSFQRTLRIPETGLHPLPPVWAGFRCGELPTIPTPHQPSGCLVAVSCCRSTSARQCGCHSVLPNPLLCRLA